MPPAPKAAALVPAALLLAGCLGSSPAPQAAEAPGAPTVLPWALEDCVTSFVSLAVPPERLAPRLPPGFRPVALGPLGLPLPAGAQAALVFDAYACGSVRWGERSGPAAYGSIFAPVEPPADLREPGVDFYFVKWDFLVPDGPARGLLAGLGLPATGGRAAVGRSPAAGGAEAVAVELALDGAGGVRASALAGAPYRVEAPVPFVEFTPTASGGLAVWRAVLAPLEGASGAGWAEPAPGWARDLVGQGTVPAEVAAATWAVGPANVTVPR